MDFLNNMEKPGIQSTKNIMNLYSCFNIVEQIPSLVVLCLTNCCLAGFSDSFSFSI